MANEKRLPETKPFWQSLFLCFVRAICQSPLQCE